MSKPKYSCDAPDQARLKTARLEIEAILQKHDIAGAVVLHTPGMAEWFYQVNPSYSCLTIDEAAGIARVRSKLADYGGDQAAQVHDLTATANMAAAIYGNLHHGARMFLEVQRVVDRATRAAHEAPRFVPDPMEGKRQ